MGMQTGENEQALRKILDMTRLMSLTLLILHFYYYCYQAFYAWGLQTGFTDKIISNIAATGLFSFFLKAKLFSLLLLFISLIGAKGQKDEKVSYPRAYAYILPGLIIFFISGLILQLHYSVRLVSLLYMVITSAGYLMLLAGGTLLSRLKGPYR